MYGISYSSTPQNLFISSDLSVSDQAAFQLSWYLWIHHTFLIYWVSSSELSHIKHAVSFFLLVNTYLYCNIYILLLWKQSKNQIKGPLILVGKQKINFDEIEANCLSVDFHWGMHCNKGIER